uniref:Uncharacterized protein n=1 Tax=Mycena chlorophos TaxID=658473 RepID=A0ABQ0LU04_MYCCL|nr:predicted protein [Mycena chlorophos]
MLPGTTHTSFAKWGRNGGNISKARKRVCRCVSRSRFLREQSLRNHAACLAQTLPPREATRSLNDNASSASPSPSLKPSAPALSMSLPMRMAQWPASPQLHGRPRSMDGDEVEDVLVLRQVLARPQAWCRRSPEPSPKSTRPNVAVGVRFAAETELNPPSRYRRPRHGRVGEAQAACRLSASPSADSGSRIAESPEIFV